MKATGIVRRIDDLGRIVIPKELRKNIFGRYDNEGAPMEFFTNGQDIILRKYDEKSEDGVCEWKKQNKTYDWQPSCEPNSTYNVAGVGWFKYCPYCGKKIKVVE